MPMPDLRRHFGHEVRVTIHKNDPPSQQYHATCDTCGVKKFGFHHRALKYQREHPVQMRKKKD